MVFKNSLPFQFYFFREVLLAGLIILLFAKATLVYIIFYLIFAFILSFNQDNIVIEVYDDQFKIIFPSIFRKWFSKSNTFYFNEISDFKFSKGYYDYKLAIIGEIVRLILPIKFVGILFSYNRPFIEFKSNSNEIKFTFSYNQRTLIEANEHIDRRSHKKKC